MPDIRTANSRRIAFLAAAVLLVTAGHYLTSLSEHQVHDIYRRLYYLPIIYAAFWYGLRGGVATAATVAILFAPHVLFQWRETPMQNLEQFLEMVMYLVVGGITGALSQKEAERREELRRANERVEESYARLKEQSRVLFDAEEQLRRADRLAALGELSAGMAHEIRNPLGSIKGTAEIFRDSLGPEHRLQEFTRILVKESDRLDGILTRFLDFARPRPAEGESCEVAPAVGDVVALTAERSKRAGIAVEFDPDDGLPHVAIPADSLRQILLNLVLNAVQAMPSGGGIAIAARAEKAAAFPGDTIVRITVSDTGPGVPAEARARMFAPFFTTKAGGTGLGLSICERIVRGHRGSIRLEDASPAGARFVVELPIALPGGVS